MSITQKHRLTLDISDGVTLSQDAPDILLDEKEGEGEQGFPCDCNV